MWNFLLGRVAAAKLKLGQWHHYQSIQGCVCVALYFHGNVPRQIAKYTLNKCEDTLFNARETLLILPQTYLSKTLSAPSLPYHFLTTNLTY